MALSDKARGSLVQFQKDHSSRLFKFLEYFGPIEIYNALVEAYPLADTTLQEEFLNNKEEVIQILAGYLGMY